MHFESRVIQSISQQFPNKAFLPNCQEQNTQNIDCEIKKLISYPAWILPETDILTKCLCQVPWTFLPVFLINIAVFFLLIWCIQKSYWHQWQIHIDRKYCFTCLNHLPFLFVFSPVVLALLSTSWKTALHVSHALVCFLST